MTQNDNRKKGNMLKCVREILPSLLKGFQVPFSLASFEISARFQNQAKLQNNYKETMMLLNSGLFSIDFDTTNCVILKMNIPEPLYAILFECFDRCFLKVLLTHEIHHYYVWKGGIEGRIPELLGVPTSSDEQFKERWEFLNMSYIDILKDNVAFSYTPKPFFDAFRFYKDLEFYLLSARNYSEILQAILTGSTLRYKASFSFVPVISVGQYMSELSEKLCEILFNTYANTLDAEKQAKFKEGVMACKEFLAKVRLEQTYPSELIPYLHRIYSPLADLPYIYNADMELVMNFSDVTKMASEINAKYGEILKE